MSSKRTNRGPSKHKTYPKLRGMLDFLELPSSETWHVHIIKDIGRLSILWYILKIKIHLGRSKWVTDFGHLISHTICFSISVFAFKTMELRNIILQPAMTIRYILGGCDWWVIHLNNNLESTSKITLLNPKCQHQAIPNNADSISAWLFDPTPKRDKISKQHVPNTISYDTTTTNKPWIS